MKINERLSTFRKVRKLTQAQLGKRAGVSGTSIATWERGETEPKIGNVIQLAQALDVTVAALVGEQSNVEEHYIKSTTNKCPVLSYVQAGQYSFSVSDPELIEEWVEQPAGLPKSYALRIVGDSMLSPNYPYEASFPEGCIVIVDQDDIQPNNGDFVVAKINGQDATTFKQYKIAEDGTPYLRPLNPRYPDMHDEFRAIATFVEKRERRWR